jgi:hypothetical protein
MSANFNLPSDDAHATSVSRSQEPLCAFPLSWIRRTQPNNNPKAARPDRHNVDALVAERLLVVGDPLDERVQFEPLAGSPHAPTHTAHPFRATCSDATASATGAFLVTSTRGSAPSRDQEQPRSNVPALPLSDGSECLGNGGFATCTRADSDRHPSRTGLAGRSARVSEGTGLARGRR